MYLADDLYLKTWPVCNFENWPFSVYVVEASESYEGLVSSEGTVASSVSSSYKYAKQK